MSAADGPCAGRSRRASTCYVAYAALAVCTLIVFTGAAVRLTGSGLGCPEWPRCDGTRLTPELHTHGIIEFSNRVMTSVVAIPCLLRRSGARGGGGRSGATCC